MIHVTDKDGRSCSSAGCEQRCTDIVGGFYCHCAEGLNITSDRTGCEGKYTYLDKFLVIYTLKVSAALVCSIEKKNIA